MFGDHIFQNNFFAVIKDFCTGACYKEGLTGVNR